MPDMYHMFVRPEGALGERGADLMEGNGDAMAQQVVAHLDLQPGHDVLEIGFGPGIGLQTLAARLPLGRVTGIDPSALMHRRAGTRNAAAIRENRVVLVEGTVEALPFPAQCFDAALAIDNLHFWPDRLAGLLEVRRVLRPASQFLCAFTPPSGGSKRGMIDLFSQAGFVDVSIIDGEAGFMISGYVVR